MRVCPTRVATVATVARFQLVCIVRSMTIKWSRLKERKVTNQNHCRIAGGYCTSERYLLVYLSLDAIAPGTANRFDVEKSRFHA